jgi:hypothetical protein
MKHAGSWRKLRGASDLIRPSGTFSKGEGKFFEALLTKLGTLSFPKSESTFR